MRISKSRGILLVATLVVVTWAGCDLLACTGITLKAKDGAVVYGRTLEWGSFDLKSRLVIIRAATSSRGARPTGSRG